MDCREFREKHAQFLDEMCSELEVFEVRSHMRFCSECDRYDTVVRRGIMLVRNLPSVRVSAGFNARLSARLRSEAIPARVVEPSSRIVRYASLAAALILTFGVATLLAAKRPTVYRMAPVVATKPVSSPSPFGTSALVATVPTGMSIWPAIMMASQAPAHFVATELASAR